MKRIQVTFTLPCEKPNTYHEYKLIDQYKSFSEAFEDSASFMDFLLSNTDTDVDTDCIRIEMEVVN